MDVDKLFARRKGGGQDVDKDALTVDNDGDNFEQNCRVGRYVDKLSTLKVDNFLSYPPSTKAVDKLSTAFVNKITGKIRANDFCTFSPSYPHFSPLYPPFAYLEVMTLLFFTDRFPAQSLIAACYVDKLSTKAVDKLM